MTYTNEEFEQLKINTKQIEQYLHTLMPNIRESITVEFGGFTERRGPYGMPVREREYELHVGKEKITGGQGGLTLHFVPSPTFKGLTGYIELYESKGYGAQFMAALCNEWQTIKSRILYEYGKQRQTVQSIRNFKL